MYARRLSIGRGMATALIISILAAAHRLIRFDSASVIGLLLTTAYLFVLIFLYWLFSHWFHTKAKRGERLLTIVSLALLCGVFSVAYHSLIELFVGEFNIQVIVSENAPEPPLRQKLALLFFRGSLFGVLVFYIYRYLAMLGEQQQAQLEIERLKQEQLMANLAQLQEQISPHFLFNSLSTLKNITSEPATKEYVLRLAAVYRYLLSYKESMLVRLGDELAFTNAYLYIMEQRFETALSVEIDVPEHYRDCQLPPLVLQILIENAIRHNVVSAQSPLRIFAGIEDGCLVVRNNLQPKLSVEPGTGNGLNNITHRCRILLGRDICIRRGPETFDVLIPLAP